MAERYAEYNNKACEADANLNQQIEKDTIHICEKHFSEEQFYICEFYLHLIFLS